VFVVTAYFNILKHVMTESFPLAVIEVAESAVSIKRVQVIRVWQLFQFAILVRVLKSADVKKGTYL
jgi:hypothetical protein